MREIGDALAQNGDIMLVRLRPVGPEIDHDLAAGAAELAHAARADAGNEARQAVAGGRDVEARSVEADEQSRIAAQHAFIDNPRHRAERVEQHAGCLAGEVSRDVRLGVAQHVVGDLGLFFRVRRKQASHAAALVTGDGHHRPVLAAYLLVAAQLCGRHLCHGSSVRCWRPSTGAQISGNKKGSVLPASRQEVLPLCCAIEPRNLALARNLPWKRAHVAGQPNLRDNSHRSTGL